MKLNFRWQSGLVIVAEESGDLSLVFSRVFWGGGIMSLRSLLEGPSLGY